MNSEPKKAEIEEEAILMEMEEAERQEIDDGMELEEDETNSSREEDDDDDEDDDKDDEAEREDMMINEYFEDLKYLDLVELGSKERAEVEDTEEDEEEDTDEDEDEFRKICNTKNWCGRA
jgi:hypothetical protein